MAYNNLNTDELRKRLDELLSMDVMNMPHPELQELLTMQECITDWEYGEILIHPDNFRDYAEDLAIDTGIIPDTNERSSPLNCIDWEEAAEELQQDYTAYSYLGETYYVR